MARSWQALFDRGATHDADLETIRVVWERVQEDDSEPPKTDDPERSEGDGA